jgi:hypothetical protein
VIRFAVVALVVVSVAGVLGLASMLAGACEPLWTWGYVAATVSFLLSAGQMAPVLSMASRVGRGYWAAHMRRVADLLALVGVISAPLLMLVATRLPDWQGRDSIWFDWPGAPGLWDSVAAIALAIAGMGLVWVVTWPERRGLKWLGSPTQWRVLIRGTMMLGALYTMLVVFLHLLVMSDFGLSLVPGWSSAVMPAYLAVSGFEIAIAMVVVLLAATHQLDARLSRSCAKLLLSLGLLWFYFVWCELLTQWYGRTPDEQSLLALFMFGPGATLFSIAVVCEFLVPALVLIWNPARGSPAMLTAVAGVVVVGGFVDRLRIFVGAWSVATPTPTEHLPQSLPPLPLPGLAELAACAGGLALAALVMVLALRRFATTSDWEVRGVERLTPERAVLRTRTLVIARPG